MRENESSRTLLQYLDPSRRHNGGVALSERADIVTNLPPLSPDTTFTRSWSHEANAAFLDAVSASGLVGLVILDPAGQIVDLNRVASTLLGYPHGELIGSPLARVLPTVPTPRRIDADPNGENPPAVESVLRPIAFRRDGSQALVDIRLRPAHGSDGARWVVLVSDISREEERDRRISDFVATVSHELRTPLTSIIGYSDLLLEGEAGDLSDTAKHYLETVVSCGERLMAIVDDLLDISRLEAGQVQIVPTANPLAPIVQSIATAASPQLAAKQQTLTIELPDDLPPVMIDRERVGQILTNLLSNAHKYTPVGGAIRITVQHDAAAIRVSVIDTGIGLSAADLSHLFSKFFRVDKRASRQAGGTGLGLAITRALVELQGGTIDVESELGAGSTFSFTLPIAVDSTRDGSEGGTVANFRTGLAHDRSPSDIPSQSVSLLAD